MSRLRWGAGVALFGAAAIVGGMLWDVHRLSGGPGAGGGRPDRLEGRIDRRDRSGLPGDPTVLERFTFVAANNYWVRLDTPNFFPDQDAETAGYQGEIQTSSTGCVGCGAVALYQGQEVNTAPVIVDADPWTGMVPISLPHGTRDVLRVETRAVDGEVMASWEVPAVVDVVPPPAPTAVAEVVHPRRALVDVEWDRPEDPDTGAPVHIFDVRYSTDAVLEDGIQTEAEFWADCRGALYDADACALSEDKTIPACTGSPAVKRVMGDGGWMTPPARQCPPFAAPVVLIEETP